MSLKWPILLLILLLPIGMYIYRRFHVARFRRQFVAEVSSHKNLPSLRSAVRKIRLIRQAELVLVIAILVCLAVIVSRPQVDILKIDEDKTHDIVLCMDTSGSMSDYIVPAFTALKKIANDNPTDKYAVSGFVDVSYTILPLTRDTVTINERLDHWIDAFQNYDPRGIDYPPELLMGFDSGHSVGTDVSRGLLGCMRRFGDLNQEKSRTIILASDLEDTSDDKTELFRTAQLVPRYGIDLYVMMPDMYYLSNDSDIDKVIKLTNAKVEKMDDTAAAGRIVGDILTKVLNVDESKQYVKADYPQPFIIVLLVLVVAWGLLVSYRWRQAK